MGSNPADSYRFTDPFQSYEPEFLPQVYDGNWLGYDEGIQRIPLQKTKKPMGVVKKQARNPRALSSLSEKLNAIPQWKDSPNYNAVVRSHSQQNPTSSYQPTCTPMSQCRSLDGCCWGQHQDLCADFSLASNGATGIWDLPQYPASAPCVTSAAATGVETVGSGSINTLDALTSMAFDRASINAIAQEGMPALELPAQGSSYSQYPDLDTTAPLPSCEPQLEASSFLNPTYAAPSNQQPTPTYSNLPSDMDGSAAMVSNGSLSSNSRATRRAQEQIAQGARRIAPRGTDNTALNSNSVDPQGMTQMTTPDGTTKHVVAIAKESAPRLRQVASPRQYCNQCPSDQTGFLGKYELRRHMERSHAPVRAFWVCVDISYDKSALANCKACRGQKRYNSLDNAIAHLRRVDFAHNQKGRGVRGENKKPRAGSSGGLFPSIDVLRHWVRKEEVKIEDEVPSDSEAPAETTSIQSSSAESGIAFPTSMDGVENQSSFVQTAMLPHSDLQFPQFSDPLLSQDQFSQSLLFGQYPFATDVYDPSVSSFDSTAPLDLGFRGAPLVS